MSQAELSQDNSSSNWENEGGSFIMDHADIAEIRIVDPETKDIQDVNDGEVRVTSPTGGEKGQKDVRLHALPWEAMSELGRVFAFGEQKYDDYNFRKGYAWSLSFDAMSRHLGAFWNRADRDKESGLHHLAHAAWHCLVLLFFSITERGSDDRPN